MSIYFSYNCFPYLDSAKVIFSKLNLLIVRVKGEFSMTFVNVLWSDRSFGGAEIYTKKLDLEFSSVTVSLRNLSLKGWIYLIRNILRKRQRFIFHDLRASLLNIFSLRRDNICVIHGPGKNLFFTRFMIIFLSQISRNIVLVSDSLDTKLFNSRVKVVNNFSSNGIVADLTSKNAIYFGRIEKTKRIEEMISFWTSRHSPGDLHIVGGGSALEDLQGKFQTKKSVKFHGPVNHDQIRQIANRCRYYISFSVVEGLSLSLLEALNGGMIPLVAKIPSQVFLHNELGLPDVSDVNDDLYEIVGGLDNKNITTINGLSESIKRLCETKFERHWYEFWSDIALLDSELE